MWRTDGPHQLTDIFHPPKGCVYCRSSKKKKKTKLLNERANGRAPHRPPLAFIPWSRLNAPSSLVCTLPINSWWTPTQGYRSNVFPSINQWANCLPRRRAVIQTKAGAKAKCRLSHSFPFRLHPFRFCWGTFWLLFFWVRVVGGGQRSREQPNYTTWWGPCLGKHFQPTTQH